MCRRSPRTRPRSGRADGHDRQLSQCPGHGACAEGTSLVPIVIAAPHATVFPERVIAEPYFDYLVYGEGEDTLEETGEDAGSILVSSLV